MSVATITAANASLSIPFLAVQFPSGFMDIAPVDQAEELTTPGVNGRRWRTIFSQFPSFQMTGIVEASTYSAAAAYKTMGEKMVQKLVTLSVTIDNAVVSIKQAHVSAVESRIFPGPVYGAGAGANAAHLEMVFNIELTDFDTA